MLACNECASNDLRRSTTKATSSEIASSCSGQSSPLAAIAARRPPTSDAMSAASPLGKALSRVGSVKETEIDVKAGIEEPGPDAPSADDASEQSQSSARRPTLVSEESRKWAADMSDEVRARARKRSELFRAGQRFYHDQHGEGVVVSSAEGMTTIRYDSGEEHTYSYESQRKLKPVVDDAHKLTPGALFDMVRAPVNLPAPATPSYTHSASSRSRHADRSTATRPGSSTNPSSPLCTKWS